MYSTQQLARLAGVSKRTLYHYESIGLLAPSHRTPAGHRRYSRTELHRLQQILLYRELHVPLSQIPHLLEGNRMEASAVLRDQIQRLQETALHYQTLIDLATQTLQSIEGGINMNDEQLFRGLRHEELTALEAQHAEEVKTHYAETEAYRISQIRQQRRSPQEAEQLSLKHKQLDQRLTQLYWNHRPVHDAEVQQVVRDQHAFIDQHYYPCDLTHFQSLGQLYVTDERFRNYYETYEPGLADFYAAAITVYTQTR